MKIAALVSGGVDSSVSLGLLEEQDADVTAFYLRIWLDDDQQHLAYCPWEEDLEYLRELCKMTNVKLEVIDMQKDYYERVVHHALEEVKAGRTPNPDIWCNTRIKFGMFADLIKDRDFDKIASGHYARVAAVNTDKGKRLCLSRAPDPIKDQTYFLSHLPKDKLGKLMFPIGKYTKAEVRKIAEDMALPNAKRKDSQGICFLGKFKYRDFLKLHLGIKTGDFVEHETGKKVGTHEGFWFYTIGQRKGLRIGGPGGAWYVVGKEVEDNVVFVSQHYHEKHHRRNAFIISSCNWFLEESARNMMVQSMAGKILVKLRHGPEMQKCIMYPKEDGFEVILNSNDQGIAPGQYAAFYRDNLCLGSGVIS
jgi:tRNA-5-taurinomethyluridine 2-sulfurtransferase